MLSYETKSKISTLLLSLSEAERQCEVVRQILCEQLEFEPFAAFCRIDRDHRGFLTPSDIKNFLADNSIGYSEKACASYVRRYSGREGEFVSYPEFLKSVLPIENARLRAIVSQRPNYKVAPDEFLPDDVEYALAKVIDREVSLYLNTDFQKFTIATRPDYSPLEAFASIDRFNSGRIDFDNLKSFFRSLALCPVDEEIIAVLRRIDKDDDGVVKYDEFIEAFETLDPELKSEQFQKGLTISSPTRQGLSETRRMQSGTKLKSAEKQVHFEPIHQTISAYQKVASPGRTVTYSPLHRYSPDRKQFKKPDEDFYAGRIVKESTNDRKEFMLSTADKSSPFLGTGYGKIDAALSATTRIKKVLDYGVDTRPLIADPLLLALKQFIKLEKELEHAKQNLALRPDFNLVDFFRVFDVDSKGAIGLLQIEEGFKKFSVYSSKDDINLVIKRYDSDGDTKLKFSDFADALTPKQNEYSNILGKRAPLKNDPLSNPLEQLSLDTRKYVSRVLRVLLENESSTERLRQQLSLKEYFNKQDAFSLLDLDEDGQVNIDDLRRFLDKQEVFSTDKELKLLLDKFDRNKDGRISYSEFVKEITPKTDAEPYTELDLFDLTES